MTYELWEGSPPYMHTRYLSEPEQTHCLQNPTYAARLHAARAQRQEVQYRQIALDVSRRTKDATKRQLEDREQELHALEDGFAAEDRVLAALAEALVRCPVFWHTQENGSCTGGNGSHARCGEDDVQTTAWADTGAETEPEVE
ncbi:hypothetical protein LTR74_015043 [Friedmanniomyces endolithicus]|nr:hypothetical protein LTR74_015043 [Friedmanniomyces endolithicus]